MSKIFTWEEEKLPEMGVLENLVNGGTPNAKRVAYSFIHWHRTLQQNAIRLLFNVIKILAAYYEEQGDSVVSDLRNEQSIKWIKEVSKIDGYFPFV